ncbi:MAG TPA: hypothetical protein VN030_13775 [Cellvibrio sp.]|nr:hypothetical protein [Cellvibrio sp.]
MKLMKTLSCLLILSLAFASYAEAKGRSFSGGFRSQRTAQAPQAAPKATPAPAAQPLNMSRDANANAAQGSTLKAADGRSTSNTAETGTGWFRSGSTAKPAGAAAAAPGAAVPAAGQAAARQGGGLLNNVMWFMLGSSLASHTRAAPAAEQAPAGEGAQAAAVAQDATVAQGAGSEALPVPPGAPQEPMLMSLLRIVLWVAIFAGIYWLVKSVMGRKARAEKKSHYTFGNN